MGKGNCSVKDKSTSNGCQGHGNMGSTTPKK
jgi:hypothetical protein